MFPIELDVHTHSVSSGHFSTDTVTDLIKEASKQNLKLLGISDHGPAIPGSCTASYFRGLSSAPSTRMGVHILYGAEVNIMDNYGRLDLDDSIMEKLDYCIAAMHPPCRKPEAYSLEENTAAYIAAMKNPYVKIIAHPDDIKYPVDYRQLVQAAMEYHVLIEVNNASLSPDGYRGDLKLIKENDRAILELCRTYHYPILLSSDSHGHSHIGDVKFALELVKEIDFPEELIINQSAEEFLRFIS